MKSIAIKIALLIVALFQVDCALTGEVPKCPEGFEYDENDNQCYVCPEGFVRGSGEHCVPAHTDDLWLFISILIS